jgi:hypothetical protein
LNEINGFISLELGVLIVRKVEGEVKPNLPSRSSWKSLQDYDREPGISNETKVSYVSNNTHISCTPPEIQRLMCSLGILTF